MGTSTTDINVSLEPHLLHALRQIYPLLPPNHAQDLGHYLTDPAPSLIPYSVLSTISQWTRSGPAESLMKSKDLDCHDYSMIALLAGTTSSPERKFGRYVPPKEPEEVAAYKEQERKSITALLNAVLSVGCVGFAAWWAADKTGWKNEWRVLFALFAAAVVAISEAGLYIIWQSRRSTSPKVQAKLRYEKKPEPSPDPSSAVQTEKAITTSLEAANLRHRR
ncbi:hypothetical protein D9613_006889 [Agrocybe pediades]|uniref:Uncharacterized protein n=1 Tax=Agrocybe pediades TaxID=84607 RepID=A0A8H4VKI0_9AGAR|nr:hypothetical protein D9613_006889 [Agrocybe pediades]